MLNRIRQYGYHHKDNNLKQHFVRSQAKIFSENNNNVTK